jgi:hypothetical protein
MNRKITFLALFAILLIFSSCHKAKKEFASQLIESYSIATQEEDERTMKMIYPKLMYFKEYPKADKIVINEMKIEAENIFATCSLYYETGLGKNVEKELKFQINSSDSIIVDILGYLKRSERNEIIDRWFWEHFNDLKPNQSDYDGQLVKSETLALNRLNGYEYYAMKAIGTNSTVKVKVYQSIVKKYYSKYYRNTKVTVAITNKSAFDMDYIYEDGNFSYSSNYPTSKNKNSDELDDLLGENEIIIHVKSGETVTKKFSIKGEFISPLEKSEIQVKPKLSSINVDQNKEIIAKYYSEDLTSTIDKNSDYWDKGYNYKIELE